MSSPISAEFLALQQLVAGRHSIERELGRGGMGLEPPAQALPSTDHTELVLGRQVTRVYEELSREQRSRVPSLPAIVARLEERAERLRAQGTAGPALTETVAALERVRLAVLQLRAGAGSVEDLARYLAAAKAVGERVDEQIEAREAVAALLKG
jgi:hypothetical protein